MSGGRGVRGNREVSPVVLLGPRGDLSGAGAEAIPKEGGSWGKHGFPHGSEPKASDVHAGTAVGRWIATGARTSCKGDVSPNGQPPSSTCAMNSARNFST